MRQTAANRMNVTATKRCLCCDVIASPSTAVTVRVMTSEFHHTAKLCTRSADSLYSVADSIDVSLTDAKKPIAIDSRVIVILFSAYYRSSTVNM